MPRPAALFKHATRRAEPAIQFVSEWEYIDFVLPLSEQLLIDRIRRRVRTAARVLHGIGDDCAVIRLPRGHEALVTTDFSLEDVHFRREWHPPESVGHRCLARGLSDIAAMGGEPIAAFLSLALPRDLPQPWIDGFLDGFLRLAKQFRVTLAGGDIAQSPAGVLADIVVLGSVPRGKAILRSGARPGDQVYVTGELGESSATLEQLRSRGKRRVRPEEHLKHFYPIPRIAVARVLREQKLASAMIDISDGLSTDLGHICAESHVGATIDAAAIPVVDLAEGKPVDLRFALHGGDDYELLFTVRPHRRVPAKIAGIPITKIGDVVSKPGMKLRLAHGRLERLRSLGWQHFTS
jgi:thiamine-monophosphate kinase